MLGFPPPFPFQRPLVWFEGGTNVSEGNLSVKMCLVSKPLLVHGRLQDRFLVDETNMGIFLSAYRPLSMAPRYRLTPLWTAIRELVYDSQGA